MSYFTLGWLREGMVVLRAVSDRNGKVLVKPGAVLTAQDLARLGAENIKGVEVQMPAESTNKAPENRSSNLESIEQAELRLEQRFRHLDNDHPLVKELRRLYRMREMPHAPEHRNHDS